MSEPFAAGNGTHENNISVSGNGIQGSDNTESAVAESAAPEIGTAEDDILGNCETESTPPEVLSQEFQPILGSILNGTVLAFLILVFALILTLFTSYTNNLDEIKPTLQFMLMPLLWVAFFSLMVIGTTAPIPRALWIPLAGFGAVSLLSALLCFQPWRAWFMNGWLYSVITSFFIIASCVRTKTTLRVFLSAYIIVGLVVILFGFFHYLGGFGWLLDMFYPVGPIGRSRFYDLCYTLKANRVMFSTILNEGFYSGFLLTYFTLGLGLALAHSGARMIWKAWEAPLGLGAAILAIVALILTKAVDTMLIAGIIALVFALLALTAYHLIPRAMAITGLAAVLALAIVLLGMHISANKDVPIAGSGLTYRGIRMLNQSAYEIFRGKPAHVAAGYTPHALTPLLGAGPGHFMILWPFYSNGYHFEHGMATVNLYSFNTHMDVLCEHGLLGLACYFAFFGGLLWLGARQIFRPGDRFLRIIQAGLLAAVLGRLLRDFISADSRWTVCAVNNWVIFGMAAACIIIGRIQEKADLPASETVPSAWRFGMGIPGVIAAVFLAIFLAIFGVRYFQSAYYNNEGIIAINLASSVPNDDSGQRRAEQYRNAARIFDQAVDWWPGFVTSYYKQAHAYSMLEEYQNSVNTYDHLSQLAPGYSETWFNYGIVYGVIANRANLPAEKSRYLRLSLDNYERALAFEKKLNIASSAAQGYQIAASQDPSATDQERKQWLHHGNEILYQTCMRPYPQKEYQEQQKTMRTRTARMLWLASKSSSYDKDLATQYAKWARDVCDIYLKAYGEDTDIQIIKDQAAEYLKKSTP